ncbi:MAG: hypothetical protein AAGC60_08665 [Acidobacteriota bacterium]
MLKRAGLPRLLILLLTAASLVLTLNAVAGERQADPDTDVPSVEATVLDGLRVVGTAMYDNDTPFRRDPTDGGTVGNRFAVNPPAGPVHSIATVSFAVAGNYSTSMVMTVWDVNPASVVVLQRQLVNGIPQSPAATGRFSAALTAPIATHSGSFIAGLRNTDYAACAGNSALASTCDGVALTQGSGPAPSDTRAARVNFTSASFVPTITNVASTGSDMGSFNAIFRVTGDNLPVELMSFDVD